MSNTIQPEPAALTEKQRAWIDQFFICGFNATEAARRSGYKDAEVSGFENKQKPEIKAEIERRMAGLHLSANEVLARLSAIATASMDDFLVYSGRGIKLDLAKAKKAGKLHLVKSYAKVKSGFRFELYDAQAALVVLARVHGLFIDQPVVNVTIEAQSVRDRLMADLAGDVALDPAGAPQEPD